MIEEKPKPHVSVKELIPKAIDDESRAKTLAPAMTQT